MEYKKLLENGFFNTNLFHDNSMSRLQYLGELIFDFTTYDSGMSEFLATKALEVCEAINTKTDRGFTTDPEQYKWYIIMCNMPFFEDKLEWGTSIRGAWWRYDISFHCSGLFNEDKQLYGHLHFTQETWMLFINAVLEFGTEG